MPNLSAYLPQDRLRALCEGADLPDRVEGSALFADISGFTPLTEALARTHGPRRGIEELSVLINRVYTTLIVEIEAGCGSVIGFAGDSMTCWFDARSSEIPAASAVAAALRMQAAMAAFPELGLKVAVTSGQVRRFVTGDVLVQRLDTLAGITVARLSTAEQLAGQGETVVDAATAEALGPAGVVRGWRMAETGERFTLVGALSPEAEPDLLASCPVPEVDAETLRPWVLSSIFAREEAGHGLLLTELRPAAAIFLGFDGIDYDGDPQAGDKLDALVSQAQAVLSRYEGALLQLTIGDKGSYLYTVFGAPLVHEDDARRAVQASLELRDVCAGLRFLAPARIGISQGVMRCGAYGGPTRRTYGVMGDDVNLAARLMMSAAPGEILLAGRVRNAVSGLFGFEPRPPLALKGKAEPLAVFAVTGQRRRRAIRLEEPHYALPMMGREAELRLIGEKLDLAGQGRGQVVGIIAEAGMGKSRLIAETVRLARKKGFTGYGGACEASGINTPYLVWKPIWQAFFGIDPEAPLRRQLRNLQGEIEDRAPGRADALPVLSVLLDLPIEDNEFTRSLEPKDRRNVLTALLEDCLRSAAAEEPVLLVLDDLHWLDALSHELLETLARVSATLPVCFLLAYRPPDRPRLQAERVEALEYFTRIELSQLTPAESEGLIRAKLAQLFPERSGALPQILARQLSARAEGNPFYIEELLNFLRDRGISPYDEASLGSLELPSSLHALILSRMDRLSGTQQAALKSASVIGRSFRLSWLHGYYPSLGTAERVKDDLDELSRLDLTPLETPEPELAYLFKHIITQEVAYESMAYGTRARLHEQLAGYIEGLDGERFLDLLAYHYGLSENRVKQAEYFGKAGAAAQATFANDAALTYYERLLPLLAEAEQVRIHGRRGAVLELVGQLDAAIEAHREALAAAERLGERAGSAAARLALGRLCRLRGEFQCAVEWLGQAQADYEALGDGAGRGQAHSELGVVCWQQGDYEGADRHLGAALTCARQAGDRRVEALALSEAGTVAMYRSDYPRSRDLYQRSLDLGREIDDKQAIAGALRNLGNVAFVQGDNATARALYEQSLAIRREIGDKSGVASALLNLGNVMYGQGEYEAARSLYEQCMALAGETGERRYTALALGNLGNVAYARADYPSAQALYEQALALRGQMGDRQGVTMVQVNLGLVAYSRGQYDEARRQYEQALAGARELEDRTHAAYALLGLGLAMLAQAVAGDAEAIQTARRSMLESLAIRSEIGEWYLAASSLVGLAGAALGLGEARRAACLLGAVAAALREQAAAVEPDVVSVHEETVSGTRASLSAAEFEAAWAEGEGLRLEQVTAEELGR